MEAAIQKVADELVEKFEEQWKPAMENLQEADAAFDDLEGAPCLCQGATFCPDPSLAHPARFTLF